MHKGDQNLILHADGDSFFVACEISVRPELRGKPVIVGGDRGIAVAMSPEAKKLGITRGMPTFQIKKFFPHVVILPHNFELYNEISKKMRALLSSYFVCVEEYSIDECFALATPAEIKYYGGEHKLLRELKKDVENTLGVSYSFGLARTKALAKQASKLEKPGGVVALLSPLDEMNALQRTPIQEVWGIGRRTVPRLERLGVKTAYDFICLPNQRIEKNFSKPLLVLKRELAGESLLGVESNVDPRDQKSIQSTATFHPASSDPKIIWREISENTEFAAEHARAIRTVSRDVSFFIKTSEFKYYSAETRLNLYTADPGAILDAIEPLFPKMLKKREKIRATGVILHNLVREEKVPRDLFGKQDREIKKLNVEKAVDRIREKFGENAIQHASSLKKNKSKKPPPGRRGSSFH